jgi:hypothetical protein
VRAVASLQLLPLNYLSIWLMSWMSSKRPHTAAATVRVGGLPEAPARLLRAYAVLTICFYIAGHVMERQSPADVPKNGKRYHIHTFGCQASLWGSATPIKLPMRLFQ